MRIFDLVMLVAVTLLGCELWFQGLEAADRAATPDAREVGILATGGGAGLPTLQLPPGLRIDPATGLLMGVTLPVIEGVEGLSWELLRTYEYRPEMDGLPDAIRKLDGQKVVMIGFLMTLFQYDDIKDFHLVANHWSCCYGVPPGLDGAVRVTLDPKHEGLPNTIKPIRVIGTLRVGEVKEQESEIVWAIYSLENAEAVVLDF
ncbi:MAG: DUF3299 domain-containing protein [Planctomycetota bacterium]|nr:DUF3299 domain-containing protein [Planctomycetota bacterium]